MIRRSAAFLVGLALSCSALAQGDARFCGNYAANASEVAGGAVKKNPACLDPSRGVHSNYQSHFEWCMRNPPSSVQGAEANIRRLAAQCTGNASNPVPAAATAPQANTTAGLTWVKGTPNNIDPRAKSVGPNSNLVVYVCRGGHNGGLHPGMTGIWMEGCSIGYGGGEVLLRNYSVLAGTTRWIKASAGSVPANAIEYRKRGRRSPPLHLPGDFQPVRRGRYLRREDASRIQWLQLRRSRKGTHTQEL